MNLHPPPHRVEIKGLTRVVIEGGDTSSDAVRELNASPKIGAARHSRFATVSGVNSSFR